MLRVDQLSFSHTGGPSFCFDVVLDQGQCLAVMGPSGVGKSTLLNLIAGFEKPSSGALSWQGQSLLPLAPDHRGVSMLFQSHNLFDHLSAARNVDLGLSPNRAATPAQQAQRDQAFVDLGIDGLQARLPADLSGGQQQRVALARCLVSDRPLILLDEPFSALDQQTRQDAIEALKVLQARGKTLVLVTHQPQDAIALGAKVYQL